MRQKQDTPFQSYIHTRLQRLEELILNQRKSQATEMHFSKLLEKIDVKIQDYTEKVRCIDLIMRDVVHKMEEMSKSCKHSEEKTSRMGRKAPPEHEQKMREFMDEVKKVQSQMGEKNIKQMQKLQVIEKKLSFVQQEIQRLNKQSYSFKFNFQQIRVPTEILVTKKQLRETIQQLHTIFSNNLSPLYKNIDILNDKYLLILGLGQKANFSLKQQPFDDYNLSQKNLFQNKKSPKILRHRNSAEREHALSLSELTKKIPSLRNVFQRKRKSRQKNDKGSLSSTQRKSSKSIPFSETKAKLSSKKEGTNSAFKS